MELSAQWVADLKKTGRRLKNNKNDDKLEYSPLRGPDGEMD